MFGKILSLAILAAALLLLFYADSASAQCEFDAPAKAKGLKTSMVRAYATCGGMTFPTPNTLTNAGVPACVPVTALSPYLFDDKRGACSLKMVTRLESPCSDGSVDPINLLPRDCSNTVIRAKCSGILEPEGLTPVESPNDPVSGFGASGWSLGMQRRVTWNDEVSGDTTVTDFPTRIYFPDGKKGRIKGKFDTQPCSISPCLFGVDTPALPTCMATEIMGVQIIDPAGRVFATMGSGSR